MSTCEAIFSQRTYSYFNQEFKIVKYQFFLTISIFAILKLTALSIKQITEEVVGTKKSKCRDSNIECSLLLHLPVNWLNL